MARSTCGVERPRLSRTIRLLNSLTFALPNLALWVFEEQLQLVTTNTRILRALLGHEALLGGRTDGYTAAPDKRG